MEGYVKLYRSSLKDPLYLKEVFTKWQAWCDLILLAYHSPTDIFVRNVKVKAKRGNVYMSVWDLGERWRWSRGKVERFLKYLEKDGRVKVNPSNVVNSITILNYEKFQQNGRTNEPTNEYNVKMDSQISEIGESLLKQVLVQMKELKERLDTPQSSPKTDKKSSKKKETNPLIAKGRDVFEKRYSDLFGDSYYWQAKDSVAMDALTKKIIYSRQQKGMSVEFEDVLKALGSLLESVRDEWILKNFSVTNVNSKYNEIVAQAKAALNHKGNDKENRFGVQDKRRGNEVTATSAKDYEGAF